MPFADTLQLDFATEPPAVEQGQDAAEPGTQNVVQVVMRVLLAVVALNVMLVVQAVAALMLALAVQWHTGAAGAGGEGQQRGRRLEGPAAAARRRGRCGGGGRWGF